MIRRIVPEVDLGRVLKNVENPARYTGGEYGIKLKPGATFRVGVCFPDLYEIGMSNQAVAILYGLAIQTEGVAAERVFCPAPDFEQALHEAGVPLYGLEEGTPLFAFDLLAITLSYELSATNVLLLLKAGMVPLRWKDRGEGDPIVLGGGPAITNPVPFGAMFEGVYIGEAEAVFKDLLVQLANLKRAGARRADLLETIRQNPSVWYEGKKGNTQRAVFSNFSSSPSFTRHFPLPNLKITHDHGVVEIMRGCPNGCRFCHAGIYYRPFRMKDPLLIEEEVAWEIEQKGYREISLSSLSSGDYQGVFSLLKKLNHRFRDRFISFSLPSLHVETFGLELLSQISEVRKSGLTFAVETPNPLWQLSLNKRVDRERVTQVLLEAKGKGWKVAKFYFMVGLPFRNELEEAFEILEFVEEIYRRVKIQIHLNVGTFVPKPHTPFQWASQLTEQEAVRAIQSIRRGMRHLPVKVGYQAPFLSFLEGLISRGDERVGELVFQAFQRGARFDAWEDKLERSAWDKAIGEAGWDVFSFISAPRSLDQPLPWSSIDLGVSARALKEEWRRAKEHQGSPLCAIPCQRPCGVCGRGVKPVAHQPTALEDREHTAVADPSVPKRERRKFFRYLVQYRKVGKGSYIPHLAFLRVWERALQMCGFKGRFTEGFNPKPYIDFAQPLSIGMDGLGEVLTIDLTEPVPDPLFKERINSHLPQGTEIIDCCHVGYWEKQRKLPSVMSCFGGGRYLIQCPTRHSEDLLSCIKNHSYGFRYSILNEADSVVVELDVLLEEQSKFKGLVKELLSASIEVFRISRSMCFGKSYPSSLYDYVKGLYFSR